MYASVAVRGPMTDDLLGKCEDIESMLLRLMKEEFGLEPPAQTVADEPSSPPEPDGEPPVQNA